MTTPCQHCGSPIGEQAKRCPACGGKIDNETRAALWLILFLLFLVVTVIGSL